MRRRERERGRVGKEAGAIAKCPLHRSKKEEENEAKKKWTQGASAILKSQLKTFLVEKNAGSFLLILFLSFSLSLSLFLYSLTLALAFAHVLATVLPPRAPGFSSGD